MKKQILLALMAVTSLGALQASNYFNTTLAALKNLSTGEKVMLSAGATALILAIYSFKQLPSLEQTEQIEKIAHERITKMLPQKLSTVLSRQEDFKTLKRDANRLLNRQLNAQQQIDVTTLIASIDRQINLADKLFTEITKKKNKDLTARDLTAIDTQNNVFLDTHNILNAQLTTLENSIIRENTDEGISFE